MIETGVCFLMLWSVEEEEEEEEEEEAFSSLRILLLFFFFKRLQFSVFNQIQNNIKKKMKTTFIIYKFFTLFFFLHRYVSHSGR